MKKLLAAILLLSSLPLAAAIYPADPDIGRLAAGNSLVLEALASPYGPQWLEAYVEPEYQRDFSALHSKTLASILPLDDVIMSSQEGRVLAKDRTGKAVMVFHLCPDGLIRSLSFQNVHQGVETSDRSLDTLLPPHVDTGTPEGVNGVV